MESIESRTGKLMDYDDNIIFQDITIKLTEMESLAGPTRYEGYFALPPGASMPPFGTRYKFVANDGLVILIVTKENNPAGSCQPSYVYFAGSVPA